MWSDGEKLVESTRSGVSGIHDAPRFEGECVNGPDATILVDRTVTSGPRSFLFVSARPSKTSAPCLRLRNRLHTAFFIFALADIAHSIFHFSCTSSASSSCSASAQYFEWFCETVFGRGFRELGSEAGRFIETLFWLRWSWKRWRSCPRTSSSPEVIW